MKKRLLAFALTAAMAVAPFAAFAQDNTPKVILNDRTVYFSDQKPVIVDEGRTLVPARGLFEAMDAEVLWNDETKAATINSADGFTRVIVTNDSPTMVVYTFTSLLSADKREVTLDAVPRIIGDRTMIPLRAISEALNADVDWDQDTQTVTINTLKETKPSQSPDGSAVKDSRVKLSMSADKTTVKQGEEITLSVKAENLEQLNTMLAGITVGMFYDKTKFEYVSSSMIVNGNTPTDIMGGSNDDYKGDSVRASYVRVASVIEPASDGVVMTFTFKALTSGSSAFILSDRITTDRGNDTEFVLKIQDENVVYANADKLVIDTTPVTINVEG